MFVAAFDWDQLAKIRQHGRKDKVPQNCESSQMSVWWEHVELKELCDMMKLVGSLFKVFVGPGTLQFESPDSFQGLSLYG